MLKVEGVWAARGSKLLFRDLTFKVDSGTGLQIEGSNGVGKTTLLRILSGITRPLRGQVLWKNTSITKDGELFKEDLLYLGHKDALNSDISVKENIYFLLSVNGIYMTPAEIYERMEKWGLLRFADFPVAWLSQGQRRRTSLFKFSVGYKKRVWVLDEPFSGLDRKGIDDLLAVIYLHLKRDGLVILTSHQNIRKESKIKVMRLGDIGH